MAHLKKGARLTCTPCGREVVVNACGVSVQTIWCCGKPMAQKKRTVRKPHKKASKKR